MCSKATFLKAMVDYRILGKAPFQSSWIRLGHWAGAIVHLTLLIIVAIAASNSSDVEIIARSVILKVQVATEFPSLFTTRDVFGLGYRLKPGKTIASMVNSIVSRDGSCEYTHCCGGLGYDRVEDIPESVLLEKCAAETDHRWFDSHREHVNAPGYNILWLVLVGPAVSFLHHVTALVRGNYMNIGLKYSDYAVSASFILIVLYQLAAVYSLSTQLLGFVCCATSMFFAYEYEVTGRLYYLFIGVIVHVMSWVPFFINLSCLLETSSTLTVATRETPTNNDSSFVKNNGVTVAVAGTVLIYTLYPVVTYIYLDSPSLQVIHTWLSIAAKTLLTVGMIVATRFLS